MGRNYYGTSYTDCKKIESHLREVKRQKQRQETILSQENIATSVPDTYELLDVIFDNNTRKAKVIFRRKTKKRIIERYVTSNYHKYPVYSDWKTTTHDETIILKLDNTELENLNKHSNFLVRKFSFDILAKINNEELFPSWWKEAYIIRKYAKDSQSIKDKITMLYGEKKVIEANSKKQIDRINAKIKPKEVYKIQIQNKLNQLNLKINAKSNYKFNILLTIITLFTIDIFNSKFIINLLTKKATKVRGDLVALQGEIDSLKKECDEIRAKTKISCDVYLNKIHEKNLIINKMKDEKDIEINKIKPLISERNFDDSFIPLKDFLGFSYKKIIGCFIIKNNINEKVYVGKSKDVIKRLKDNFDGFVPKNVSIAEDYFNYKGDRENMFSIKIIELNDKAILDEVQKDLIFKYDSFRNGYNKTSGNS